ncbi:reticulon-4-interacting protein 1, mitochondrial [Vanessa cardui]|uniref:reticulon-4-interacting protein 1, mitochondrial n=1 Tax=Vanessa cardui TaxID=171605 RepID=UPI001F1493F0|nr:reticulon-4-interacting protein 1, mitochondrial [Vanessa cardui]
MSGWGRGLHAGRMQAWRVHAYGSGELRLEQARVPALRAPDDVLVRVRAASLNPLDLGMIGGYGARVLNTLRKLEGSDVEFPLVLGRDFVGEVELAGAATALRPGERVWGVVPPHWQGAHAQYVLVKNRWIGPAPRSLSDSQAGGALYAALTACAALRAGGVAPARPARRPPRALLLGLGGVGHAALQLLVCGGAQVVVGCSDDLRARATELGAVAALDRNSPDYDRLLEESGPYEVILDCAGLGGAEAGARRWRFSRYVTLSSPLLRETDAHGVLAGTLRAAGSLASQCAGAARTGPAPTGPCPPHVRWAYFMPSAEDIEMLRRLAERGKFTVQVERSFPWWEGGAAYERAGAGAARGKLVLDFAAAAP